MLFVLQLLFKEHSVQIDGVSSGLAGSSYASILYHPYGVITQSALQTDVVADVVIELVFR